MTALAAQQGLLDALGQRGRRRALMPIAGVDFASNDYLGLAGSTLLRELAGAALAAGVLPGAGAARLLRGNHDSFVHLESEAAAHFGTEAALYFGSGYAANLALASALPGARDLVLHDALIHASTRDGLRLGAAQALSFRHNDAADARAQLQGWRQGGGRGQVWIALESLYSMDGDFAPLDDFAAVARETGAILLVDEAHATGIWGRGGRGLSAGLVGLEDQVISLHTCGKALGVQGGLVCAPRVLISVLVNRGRSFIYSTAPSPLCAEILRGVLGHLAGNASHRIALEARVGQMAKLACDIGLPASKSQILPVILGGDQRVMAAAQVLQEQGFDIRAIRSPTVAKGQERLRLSLTLNPDDGALEALFAAMAPLLRSA